MLPINEGKNNLRKTQCWCAESNGHAQTDLLAKDQTQKSLKTLKNIKKKMSTTQNAEKLAIQKKLETTRSGNKL